MNDDLSQLRDIHLPESVSWWPPAIGWWLLLLVIGGGAVLFVWLYKRHQAQRWRKVALAELARIRQMPDSRQQVKALSVLLRRVAVTCYPRDDVASLTGEAWLRFLDSAFKDERFQTQGALLISAPYMDGEVDAQPLLELSGQWLRAVSP